MANKKNIVMLPIGKLYHHPRNRKDMGDLTELVGSISVNGILQNLMVVPFDPVDHTGLSVEDPHDAYVVVIGNRRLEAAKLANLEELPCDIAMGISLRDQVKAMAQENLLRKRPTAREQAESFQMLLELGDSIQEISNTCGFSTTTVRTRLKLTKLDLDKLDAAEARGGTLEDYAKLDQIADPELKNKVLDSIGTPNFQKELEAAKSTEKRKEYKVAAEELLATFATKIETVDAATMKYVRNYSWWNRESWYQQNDPSIPDDTDKETYYYLVGKDQVELYRATGGASDLAEEIKKKAVADTKAAVAKRVAELEEASLRAYTLRLNFIKNCTVACAKKHLSAIVEFYGQYIMDRAASPGSVCLGMDFVELSNLLGIADKSGAKVDAAEWKAATVRAPEYALLAAAFLLADGNKMNYFYTTWSQLPNCSEYVYVPAKKINKDLDAIYALLSELGYEMSDEEKMLQDGSHPLLADFEEAFEETIENENKGD